MTLREDTMDLISGLAERAVQEDVSLEAIQAAMLSVIIDKIEVATFIVGPDVMAQALDAILESMDNDLHEYFHEANDYYVSMRQVHTL